MESAKPETRIKIKNRAYGAVVGADERWLSRLVLNLVANAKRAAEGGTVRVEVGTTSKDFYISVSDNGKGLSEAQKKKFRKGRRFTTKTAVPEEHGLGSQVVKRALSLHNATIGISDNKPRGTVIRVKIPLARE